MLHECCTISQASQQETRLGWVLAHWEVNVLLVEGTEQHPIEDGEVQWSMHPRSMMRSGFE